MIMISSQNDSTDPNVKGYPAPNLPLQKSKDKEYLVPDIMYNPLMSMRIATKAKYVKSGEYIPM